jgi:protein-tyrosine-phosphatase|tara:strand:- start:3344 stop:3802 length:459 start_codon:yes stop_codon:yes gene_type:complete
MKYITMICGHNSGRSQMSQAIFNLLKKLNPKVDSEYEAISWGTGIKENSGVNPKIIEPLKEIGIDVSDSKVYFPKIINHLFIQERLKDVVKAFTMGCMDKACELPAKMQITSNDIIDWDLEDPAKDETDVTAVRGKIIGKTLELIEELNKKI